MGSIYVALKNDMDSEVGSEGYNATDVNFWFQFKFLYGNLIPSRLVFGNEALRKQSGHKANF